MIDPLMTFDEDSVNEILSWFNKSIDDEGYVTENGQRVLAMDGKEIKADEVAGVINVDGKEKLVRNDIGSLIELNDIIKNKQTVS